MLLYSEAISYLSTNLQMLGWLLAKVSPLFAVKMQVITTKPCMKLLKLLKMVVTLFTMVYQCQKKGKASRWWSQAQNKADWSCSLDTRKGDCLNQRAVKSVCMWSVCSSPLCVFLPSDLSLLRFITTELTRGYFLEHNEAKYTERRERVYTCLRIPKELEKVNTQTVQPNTVKNVLTS